MSIIAAAGVLLVRTFTPHQKSIRPHHAPRRRGYVEAGSDNRARYRL